MELREYEKADGFAAELGFLGLERLYVETKLSDRIEAISEGRL